MTTITVTTTELHARLHELLDAARGGAEVVVQDGDAPPIKLAADTPLPPVTRPFIFGMHPGSMVMSDDFDDPIDEEDFLKGDI